MLTTLVVGIVACGDDDGPIADAGPSDAPREDALVIDGGPILDAMSDAGSEDSGSDAGTLECRGSCDPIEGLCEGGACVLAGAVPMCVVEPGVLTEGMPCEAPEACAAGLACFLKRELGVCGRICCPTGDACLTGERCGGTGLLVTSEATGFRECLPPRPCDVLDLEACEPMEACYVVSSEAETDCRRAGDAELGETCDLPNDCAPGLLCAGFFEQTCARICHLGEEGSCSAEEGDCIAYAQSPEGTGICTPEVMPAGR